MADTCTLISDLFGIIVQVFLGAGAISTLVYKRSRESPQRPWLIWGFDVSKQGFAAALQHLVNVLLGLVFGSNNGHASQCIWYIINFAITSFCGIFIIYVVMKLYDRFVEKHNLILLKSGYYGTPPKVKAWLVQLFIWCIVCCSEKLITATVVIYPLYEVLDKFGMWLESGIKIYPHLELVLVMVVGPTLINSAFFWICDNIIKNKKTDTIVKNPVSSSNRDNSLPYSMIA
tara:strand:- start:5220 stop:5912 length:693 start_codon:yes stop_codon:yes gene_type:complete